MAEFVDTLYKPCLQYEPNFYPQDGIEEHTILVEFTKSTQPVDKEKGV